VEGIRSHFADRFSAEELGTLAELLARLPLDGPEAGECAP
jgi:hypothetical protein